MKYILFYFIIFSNALVAQNMSWKKHAKTANQYLEQGDFAKAAEHYEMAWKGKSGKKELIFKAANAWLEIRNYRKAALAFENIKSDLNQFPRAGLKYARCLKQDEQYTKAKQAYNNFINHYDQSDKKIVSKIVRQEVKGCNLALQLKEQPTVEEISINHLSENINTIEQEFAPTPFSADILYFSSTMAGKSKIYRSQYQSGNWSKAIEPKLPSIDKGHICNGTFSPDNERFYFNVCQEENTWKGYQSKCEIYVTMRNANIWTPPQRLHDYVHIKGSTAIHPHVVHIGKMEFIYFSSDREGGSGGLDIWYMNRPIESGDIDFSLPRNAGKTINTVGDEITPHYDVLTQTLFFSSNGHAGIGGFDIFKSVGKKSQWEIPENMGLPVNSSADDTYYHLIPESDNAYLVSNRLFGLEKIVTTQEDIFSVSAPIRNVVVKGEVFDKNNNVLVKNIQANIYELTSGGKQRLLNSKSFESGGFEFKLLPNRNLRIIIEKEGYISQQYDFDTHDFDIATGYGKNIYLEKGKLNSSSRSSKPVFDQMPITSTDKNSKISDSQQERPTNNTRTGDEVTASTTPVISRSSPPAVNKQHNNTTSKKNRTSGAPVHAGTYYKVQLTVVVGKFNSNHSSYNAVKKMGRLDTEPVPGKTWQRVLLADFFSIREAKEAMLKAHQLGYFDAFLVRYKNGIRKTP